MKHAKYSPSKLSRILTCPASGQCEDSRESSTFAEEGSLLHAVTEAGLQAHLAGQSWVTKIRGFDLGIEQLNVVEDCMLYALQLIKEHDPYKVGVEVKTHITHECYGTADLILYCKSRLIVVDWKFGQGIEVSAIENPQLKAYGWGAILDEERQDSFSLPIDLHVVQPRLSNYSVFETTIGDLARWVNFELIPGLFAAKEESPVFNPTIDACRWCPKKQTCSARLSLAMSNAEVIFAEHAKLPDISLNAIYKLLPLAEQVEQVIKDLKLYAQQQLTDGKEVKGYKLVQGRSNRAWLDKDVAAEFLSGYLEPEEMYDVKMVSPAKAEKLLNRDLRKEDDFLTLIYKPEGKVTLAPESDKRPALSLGAESAFAGCTSATTKE